MAQRIGAAASWWRRLAEHEPLSSRARSFAQGMTEELTTTAAMIPGVRVASRTSLVAMQHATKEVREIGARLGLDAVVEGSVRQSGGRIRVTVRLVNVTDGCQLWTERYERGVTEGFEGQDALARDVIDGVKRALER